MTAPAAPPAATHAHEYPTFGLPSGSVRGFLSVLICSFFWVVLLLPADRAVTVPLGHFFLLTLVFMAFASHPLPEAHTHTLPWLMRVLFVGGSAGALALAVYHSSHLAAARLTPSPDDVTQWPVLLGCLAGGFGVALFLRFVMGRRSEFFMTVRAWVGVVAVLLLLAETLLQFAILPTLTEKPSPDALKVWEGVLIAAVAGYFGSRA